MQQSTLTALLLLAWLAACSDPAAQQQALAIACNIDGVLVPIAQPIVADLGSGDATVAQEDALLVHPAVMSACAALGGVPANVAPAAEPAAR